MAPGVDMEDNAGFFARDAAFWKNYEKGRPPVPQSFFDRVFGYHEAHGGSWHMVHDVGAGNAPYMLQLHRRFRHVILSDVVPKNVELARARVIDAGLDAEDFTFRVARLENNVDIGAGSIDMVFATNVMHFPDPQQEGMAAISAQLRPGGTFAAAAFGPARFDDPALQHLWTRMGYEGGRQLLKSSTEVARASSIRVMGRTQGSYNVAPLNPEDWQPGSQRIHINMANGGIQAILPPELADLPREPNFTGRDDETIHTAEEGWGFEWSLQEVKDHMASFPFISQFPAAHSGNLAELETLRGPFKGSFPVKIILATRR